jgi:hypothetical protein
MNPTTGGWVVFIGSLGMMATLMAPEVGKLVTWGAAFAPGFVAIILGHFGAVVLAFVGGKIIPATRDNQLTRSTDPKPTQQP